MSRRPPRSTPTDTLFPYTTLFRSSSPLQAAPSLFEVTAGGMAWTLPPDTDPVALHRAAAGQAAPCPALVEVGTIDDRALLVDLASPSSTAIVADAAAPRRLLLSPTYGLPTPISADHLHLHWRQDEHRGGQ